MVNSGSFDSDRQGDRNAKAGFTQPHTAPDSTQSSSPVTASVATPCKTDFSRTADCDLPTAAHGPTPTKTEFNSDIMPGEKASLCCSLPLEKVQGVLTPFHPAPTKPDDDGARSKPTARKLLCLYCDRSFVSANLRQKHVERVHSVRQNRRVSSRRQNQLTVTPCVYCDRLNGTENTLKDLFQHLVNEHSSKYFGCLPCEDRFLTSSHLADHNASLHQSASVRKVLEKTPDEKEIILDTPPLDVGSKPDSEDEGGEDIPVKVTRSKLRPKAEMDNSKKTMINKKKSTKLKELRAKKLSVKSSRIAMKRRESKRLQAIAKITETQKKKRPKPAERKQANKTEPTNSTKSTEKSKSNSTSINPYPEFDHFYRVKKITDHSIDNLKISSLTFDDVFDKAFFTRIKCNIEENLLHHIDGKLFKNEESESRISNFEKISNTPQEIQSSNSENYGCELSLNAVTPVASLSLTSQFGEDFESQIEYGSKPSKKKTQTRKDEVHYKYFTRRKYQASILEHKENRDLSKLDMWTQLVIKRRQQKMLDDKKSAKEILEYTTCDEYKNKIRREELNRILDRRGPFEDLKEEASKKAALDKLNLASTDNISQESFTEVREVLNEILNRVFANTEDLCIEIETIQEHQVIRKPDIREIPGYLNLRRSSSLPSDGEIDKSDRIALICSSQETENFELPTNQVRGKNELVELTGEWARCRMYICAACGAKLPNMKFLLEHKSLYHQNVWVQHYEFVGNQSELYRHLSIPALGKVGAVEESVQCKLWRRSDARVCTKCGKQCNALAELHRHILECGGDWTWMLARKKCKYRPYGARSRRKRRGLIHRVHLKRKTEPTEKKTYKKRFEGPRQRPSDADTIERMLANLPAKRSTRKLISLYDGIYRARKKTQININQNKVKCGKVIYKTSNRKDTTEKTVNASKQVNKPQKSNLSTNRRSLRSLNKVLASRILDTNAKLTVKRKLKALNEKRKTRQTLQAQEKPKVTDEEPFEESAVNAPAKTKAKLAKNEDKGVAQPETATKRSSPRSSPQNVKNKVTVKKLLTGNISIKSFFPVKKKKHKKDVAEAQIVEEVVSETENKDVKTRSKRKSKEICEPEEEKREEVVNTKIEPKKTKSEKLGSIVRSLSFHKKVTKSLSQNSIPEVAKSEVGKEKQTSPDKKKTLSEAKLKKRKLKSSLRSVINKVKKIKIDNSPNNSPKKEAPKKPRSPFLDESTKEGSESLAQVGKTNTPLILEVSESTADLSTSVPVAMTFNEANENPPIPETIFKLELNNEKNLQAKCELDFDSQLSENKVEDDNTKLILEKEETLEERAVDKTQPITIETSVKPKVVPMISPNMKGKIRKPTRGLNDCIAMLTSKLQQKTVEETATKPNTVFNVPTLSTYTRPPVEIYMPKTECILRIPTFKTHNVYPEIEETALDLSTKSLNSDRSKEILKAGNISHISIESIENVQLPKIYNSVDQTIEDVVENKMQRYLPALPRTSWNSVDETIQKVIENAFPLPYQDLQIAKIPVRSTVDDIIDFVVTHGTPNDIATDLKPDDSSVLGKSTKISSRKIGSVRRLTNKKSALESPKIGGSTEEVAPKITPPIISTEILATIATATIEKAIIEKFKLVNATDNPVKKPTSRKKKNVKKLTEEKINIQPPQNLLPNGTENKFETDSSAIISQLLEDIIKTTKCDIENTTCNNIGSDVVKNVESDLNTAFISVPETGNQTKSKKGARKVGQNRNRSRSKKVNENVNQNQEKLLLETNVDVLSEVKEVKANMSPPHENINDGILTKSEEMKQMVNEDEPVLLENKIMTPQCIAFPQKESDSEDDLPLAALVRPEDECADNQVVENKESNDAPKTHDEVIAPQDVVAAEGNILPENSPVTESITEEMDKTKSKSNEINRNSTVEDLLITSGEVLPVTTDVSSKTLTLEEELEAMFNDTNSDETRHETVMTEASIPMLNQINTPENYVNQDNRSVTEVEKETEKGKKTQNRKRQKSKPKSVRRKSSAPKPLPKDEDAAKEKSDSSTDSDVPLTDILKAVQILPTASIEDVLCSSQNSASEEKLNVIESSIESSTNKLPGDFDPDVKTTKRRSRSIKAKPSRNSKTASTNLPPVELADTLNSQWDETISNTNNLVESDTSKTQLPMDTEVESTEADSPPDKNHDSQSDLDSDTPLAVIVAVKNTEDVLQPRNLDVSTPVATADIESDSDTPLTKFISNKNAENECVKKSTKKKTRSKTPLIKDTKLAPAELSTTKSDNTSIATFEECKNSTVSDLILNSASNPHDEEIGQSFLEPAVRKNSSKRRSRSLKKKSDESILTNIVAEEGSVNLEAKVIGDIENDVNSIKAVTRPSSTKEKPKPQKKKESDSVFSEESNISSLSDSSCADVYDKTQLDSSNFKSQFSQPKTKGGRATRSRSMSVKSNTSTDDISADSLLNDSSLISNDQFKEGPLETSSPLIKSIDADKKKTRPKRKQTASPDKNETDTTSNSTDDTNTSIANNVVLEMQPKPQPITKKATKKPKSSKKKPLRNNLTKVPNSTQEIENKIDQNVVLETEPFEFKESDIENKIDQDEYKEIGDMNLSKPNLKTKNKKSRPVKKTPVVTPLDEITLVASKDETFKSSEVLSKPKKANKKRSKSLKHDNSEKIQEILGNTINALLLKVNDDPIFNSKVKSNRKGRSKSLTNSLDADKLSVLELENTDISKEDIKVSSVKPMLKRRQSLRNSQKEKCKENKSFVTSNNEEQEGISDLDLSQNIKLDSISDVLKEPNVFSVEVPSNEIDKHVDEKKIDDISESHANHFQEPPIKIVINKQKTRRKSKSFKKADLKGQNDLFEDFSLVIKKPKRIAPIITYTPADTFARDIYPKYIKQPVEQLPSLPLQPILTPSALAITPNEPEEAEDMSADLDASVEEMDMELDEIPIVSNIIERDSTSFIATPTTNMDATETVALGDMILQNDQNVDANREGICAFDTLKNSSFGLDDEIFMPILKLTEPVDDAPQFQQFSLTEKDEVEDIFQPLEKDLPSITSEECLFESSVSNCSKKTVRETKTSKKSKSKSRTRGQLRESFEVFENMDKSEKESSKSEEIVVGSSNDVGIKDSANRTEETNIVDLDINKPSDELVVGSVTAVSILEEVAMDISKKDSFNCTKNTKPVLNDSKSKKGKKKSKGKISENTPLRKSSNFNSISKTLKEESTTNKEKDIDSIYTFTELEDLEIEKPIEIPLRMARKQSKLLLASEIQIDKEDNPTDTNVDSSLSTSLNKDSSIIEAPAKTVGKRKSRYGRDLTPGAKEKTTGEIKENAKDVLENSRRKSVRNAKVKAIEHIHDDALAELTESERNREKTISSEEVIPAVEELPKKKSTRKQSRAQVQEISESTVHLKEIDDTQPLVDDLETLTNIVGVETEDILKSQEDINVTTDELDENVSGDKTTTKDIDLPLATNFENLETISDERVEDKLLLEESKEMPKVNKKNSKNKKQIKSRKCKKPFVDNIPNDVEKSTTVEDLEKELLKVAEEIDNEIVSSEDNSISLTNKPNKISKKGQKLPFSLPELSKSADAVSDTLDVDGLKVLENSIQNELEHGRSVVDSVPDSDELSNKLFNKKTDQIERNEKLLDTFDSSSEIAQKCAELIDFADNIAGLEELENSIERELNLEIEATKKTKHSKKQPQRRSESEDKINEEEESYQELRRSRRGSRKVTSYNENDLIDPLLDEIDGKRKSRKKERTEDTPDGKITKKPKESEKKLNSDELFDLLKATSNASSNEKTYVPKTCNTFIGNLGEDSSKSITEENFGNVFENMLQKSFLLQSSLENKAKEKDIDKIYEFTESPENTEHVRDELLSLEINRKSTKKPPKRNKSPLKAQIDENCESVITISSSDNIMSVSTVSDLSVDSKIKFRDKTDTDKSNYCEICNKSFMRTESLTKHKRTLTHIQKLSELEAKEAEEKSKLKQTQSDALLKENSDTSSTKCDISRTNINISDILQDSNKPSGHESPIVHSSFANNHSLKLADIINDVLNKPVLESNEKHNNFSDIIMQNSTETQPEYRRYKSLGERKSFDSEPVEPQPIISEPYMSKTTILEKQISLLENIIDHQSGVNYIDDISMSSNNTRQSSLDASLKQDDSSNVPYNTTSSSIKPTSNDDSFLKPSQYEEISEDSVNLRNYEDQKLRKALNRDEELFLECCSLLKSGSEVSSYSNKKLHGKILSNMGLKQCDEPEWLERKSLVQKPMYGGIANEYSDDNSRIPTPLGDSYDDDASNSNTISSNWNMNMKASVIEDKQAVGNKNFSFEVLNMGERKKEVDEGNSKFGKVMTQAEKRFPADEIEREPFIIDDEPEKKQDDLSDGSTSDSKKIITKGARKVFEGLKVSIPTEELNLEEVLNCSPKQKKVDLQIASETARLSDEPMTAPAKPLRTARKSKPVKNKSQVGSNVLFKMNKKKVLSPTTNKNKEDSVKTHDIYDFEETQDNTDVFTKPDFKTFRNMKSNETLPEPESDTESHDYLDSFSLGAPSMNSSVSSSSSKKPKTQENITKKKCMIMGRIFKNQAKSKIEDIDEEMRKIPEIDNSELVENYVADCKKIVKNEEVVKPKLSETEIDLLFDQLLESRFENNDTTSSEIKPTSKSKPEIKRVDYKKKMKPKNRKRARTNSESTDDEFNINKVTKKRAYRKNGKVEDNCINLEQELKECIGVASRKSQRKCTSGKQNVLVEYWSSDESQFEALLETQRLEVKFPDEEVDENEEPQQLVSEIPRAPVVERLPEVPKPSIEVPEKPHKPKKADNKRPQQKKRPSSEKMRMTDAVLLNRRKRAAANPLYHWSSSSEDESHDLIEVKPIRDELEDEEDRPIQHGWIVGDSPKKLVTMLAQAKGKKTDIDCVKEQGKKRTNAVS